MLPLDLPEPVLKRQHMADRSTGCGVVENACARSSLFE
jgi:hypothetical protein